MIRRSQFKKPGETSLKSPKSVFIRPRLRTIYVAIAPSCKKIIFFEDLKNNLGVCPICFKHLKIKARERIQYITDTDTFEEFFGDLKSNNILDFPDYDQKLNASQEQSSENEAVITGVCKINGIKCCIFAMEPFFL